MQLDLIQNEAQSTSVASDGGSEISVCNSGPNESGLEDEFEKKCHEMEALKKQLASVEEELEMERKQRKISESNFGEKVSSVDEFEANEMRIASMNEECIEEIEKLKNELEELKKINENMEKSMMESFNEKLNEETENLRIQLKESLVVTERIENAKEELDKELNKVKQEFEDEKEEVACLNLNIDELKKEIRMYAEEKGELNRNIETLKTELNGKEIECKNVLGELELLRSKSKSLTEEMEELKKLNDNSERMGESNAIEKYKKAYKKVKDKFNEIGSINEDLKIELQKKTMLVEELKKDANVKNEIIEKRVGENEEKKLEIDRISKEISEKDLIISELKKEMENMKASNETSDLIAENNELKNEIKKMEGLEEKLKEFEDGSSYLECENNRMSQEIENVKMELNVEREMNCKQKTLIETIGSEKANLEKYLQEVESKVNDLQSKNEKLTYLTKEFEMSNEVLDEEKQRVSELTTLVENLGAENEEIFAMNKQLNEEKDEIQELMTIMKNDLETLRNSELEKDSSLQQLNYDFSNAVTKLNEYELETEQMEQEIIKKESEIKKKEETILNIEFNYQQVESNLKQVCADLEEERKRFGEILRENEELKSAKEELCLNLEEKNSRISLLENSKVEIVQQLKKTAFDSKSDVDVLENEIKLLKEKYNGYEELKKEFEIMKKNCEEKELEIQESNAIITDQNGKLEILSKELHDARTENETSLNATEVSLSSTEKGLQEALEKIGMFLLFCHYAFY